jgi:hypothetical protein
MVPIVNFEMSVYNYLLIIACLNCKSMNSSPHILAVEP